MHGGHLGAQGRQPGNLGVDLGYPAGEQLLGRFARTLAGIPHRQQVADVGQCQAEALGALDEVQTVDGSVVVLAITGRGARSR
ncbi:hypothetical protein BJ988_005971 [Nocardioides panzhihuensis]|uniref:Uncharacterized protein n=1 Tax=Nocardioides panzhihuensis TaxID=860243 RepID=A0A7Z0DT96_9ACTN|nr:hypothetical protein [Nocardioides panzhihuensis]NYI81263.1 hypothetical protein [Nocardioides panzhihuensis]